MQRGSVARRPDQDAGRQDAEMDPVVGREQRGVRPCIVVSDPAVNAEQRFPLIAVVPVTGTIGTGALYPVLAPGTSGLVKQSCALIDHLRAIDKRRIRRIFGPRWGSLLITKPRIPQLILSCFIRG